MKVKLARKRAHQLFWAAAVLGTASMCAHSQTNSRLEPEPVAAVQDYRGMNLELTLYKYEDGKTYGGAKSAQTNNSKLLASKASRDGGGQEATATVAIGERVVACVTSSQAGTLTLWSQLDDQPPVKIYPNKFTTSVSAGSAAVTAGNEVCVGHNSEFRLRVAGQPGQTDKVYAHWAPDASGQLETTDFPAIGRSARVQRSAATYASVTVAYKLTN